MSRSYRKPYCSDLYRNGTKIKRPAVKAVRRVPLEELSGGCQYKRYYCSWNIHDYKYLIPTYNEAQYFSGTEEEYNSMVAKFKRK